MKSNKVVWIIIILIIMCGAYYWVVVDNNRLKEMATLEKSDDSLKGDVNEWSEYYDRIEKKWIGTSKHVKTLQEETNAHYTVYDAKVDSINNSFDKIHVFKNYVLYFDQKKYLTTINFNTNTIILNKNIIDNVQSYKFFNNSLITLNNDSLLKSFNIYNGNLFWKVDTKDTLLKDDKIINIANSETSLFIFFQGGNILELDPVTGQILSIQKLKLKNINSVYFVDKYILIHQQNGKKSFFIQ